MPKIINNPYSFNDLLEKRSKIFNFYKDNQIIIENLELHSNIKFGKFKNSPINELITENSEYIEWLIDSTDDKCFNFNKNYFFVSKYLKQQHIQLNAIKYEISQLQKNNDWFDGEKKHIIPEFYKYIS